MSEVKPAEAAENTDPTQGGKETVPDFQAANKRAMKEAAKANAVTCSNTKLVACMDSLGFPSDCKPAEHVATGNVVREFLIQARSLDPVFAHLRIHIVRDYETGKLEATEPMHPLCVAMRGMHNYDRLQDMQKQGAVMNLRSTAFIDPLKPEKGGQMTIYKRFAQMDPRSHFSAETVERDNLMLVAALGGVGIPVLSYDGVEGSRRYTLPRFGYALARMDGTLYLEDADSRLFDLAPTPQDPWALAICSVDPLHPVPLVYNALRSRIRLRELLGRKAPRLHVQDGDLQALITANYTGRVMERLTERFGVPPI